MWVGRWWGGVVVSVGRGGGRREREEREVRERGGEGREGGRRYAGLFGVSGSAFQPPGVWEGRGGREGGSEGGEEGEEVKKGRRDVREGGIYKRRREGWVGGWVGAGGGSGEYNLQPKIATLY